MAMKYIIRRKRVTNYSKYPLFRCRYISIGLSILIIIMFIRRAANKIRISWIFLSCTSVFD